MPVKNQTKSLFLSDFLTESPQHEGLATYGILFAGAGFLDRGLTRRTDFALTPSWVLDIGYDQTRTYKRNFPYVKDVLQADITKTTLEYKENITLEYTLDKLFDLRNQRIKHDTEMLVINWTGLTEAGKELVKKKKYSEENLPAKYWKKKRRKVKRFVDVIIETAPCIWHSGMSMNPETNVGEAVRFYSLEGLKYIEASMPDIVMLENVPRSQNDLELINQLAKPLIKLGYKMTTIKMSSKITGSVQDKGRYFLFFSLGRKFDFLPFPKAHNKRLEHVLRPGNVKSDFDSDPNLIKHFKMLKPNEWCHANAEFGIFRSEDRFFYKLPATKTDQAKANYILRESNTGKRFRLIQTQFTNGKTGKVRTSEKWEALINDRQLDPNAKNNKTTKYRKVIIADVKNLKWIKVNTGKGTHIKTKKAENTIRLSWKNYSKTLVQAMRNWIIHPSGYRTINLDEIQAISGADEGFKIMASNKFNFCQMVADSVDSFQGEFLGLNIAYNLYKDPNSSNGGLLSLDKALRIIEDFPDYAMKSVPSWSNPELAMSI